MAAFKTYRGTGKPYLYAIFTGADKAAAEAVLGNMHEHGHESWYAPWGKRERKRMEMAAVAVAFLTPEAMADDVFSAALDEAIAQEKPIVCIYLAETVLTAGRTMQLGSLQALNKYSYESEEGFYDKLYSSEVLHNISLTPAQKKMARTRGILSIALPVIAAAAILLVILNPFKAEPVMVVQEDSVLGQLGFAGLTEEDLLNITELNICGDTVLPKWPDYWDESWNRNGDTSRVYDNGSRKYYNLGSISDISDLALLKNLRKLSIQGNQITDISPLFELTQLEQLKLNCNPITNIKGIEAMSELRMISLANCEVEDISPLFNLPNLKHLQLEYSPAKSIEGIEKCKYLCGLYIDGTQITDLSPLANVDFSYAEESSGVLFIGGVSGDGGVLIHLSGIPYTDLSALARIKKFDYLTLTDGDPTKILPYLEGSRVYLFAWSGKTISHISELSGISGIKQLHLPHNPNLISLNGIEAYPDLFYIKLVNCPNLRDLTPLLSLPKIERLIISEDMRALAEEQLQDAKFNIEYNN